MSFYNDSLKNILVIGNKQLNEHTLCHETKEVTETVIKAGDMKDAALLLIDKLYINQKFDINDRLNYLTSSWLGKVWLWLNGQSAKHKMSDRVNDRINERYIDKIILGYNRGDYTDIVEEYFIFGEFEEDKNYYIDYYGNLLSCYYKESYSYFSYAKVANPYINHAFATNGKTILVNEKQKSAININNFSIGEITLFINMLETNPKKFNKLVSKYKGKEKEIKEFIQCERDKKNGTFKETKQVYKSTSKKTNSTTVGEVDKINFKLIEGVILCDGKYYSLQEIVRQEVINRGGWRCNIEHAYAIGTEKFKKLIKDDILYCSKYTTLRMFEVE